MNLPALLVLAALFAAMQTSDPEPSSTPLPEPAVTTAPAELPTATEMPTPAPEPTATPLPTPAPVATDPYFILQRAREAFHAHVRPPFIAYNMDRMVWLDDQPDGGDGYTLRIWCRTGDAASLARIWSPFRKRAIGSLYFIRFNLLLDIDPGPPTADIFEPPPPVPSAPPAPQPRATESLRTIAVVAKRGDLDYRATLAGIEKGAYHLKLEPLRDEQRNRLRELWVDAAHFEVMRAIEVSRPEQTTDQWLQLPLAGEGTMAPIRLDMTFEPVDGVPILRKAIELEIVYPGVRTTGHRVEVDYHYDRIVFSQELPGWYFDAKTYRPRFRDSPSY